MGFPLRFITKVFNAQGIPLHSQNFSFNPTNKLNNFDTRTMPERNSNNSKNSCSTVPCSVQSHKFYAIAKHD